MTIVLASKTSILDEGRTLDAVVMLSDSQLIDTEKDKKFAGQKIFTNGTFLISAAGDYDAIVEEIITLPDFEEKITANCIAQSLRNQYQKAPYQSTIYVISSFSIEESSELFLKKGTARYPLEMVVLDINDLSIKPEKNAIFGSGKIWAREDQYIKMGDQQNLLAETILEMYMRAVSAQLDESVDGNRQYAIQVRDRTGEIKVHALYPEAVKMHDEVRISRFESGKSKLEGTPLFFKITENNIIDFHRMFEDRLQNAADGRVYFQKSWTEQAKNDYLSELNELSSLVKILATGNLQQVANAARKPLVYA